MKKNIVLIGLCLLCHLCLNAQEDTITQRIVLIGDAGQLTNGRHPVVDAVRKYIPLDKRTTVLFLGDNLYKNGLPDDAYKSSFETAKAILDSQLSVADGTPSKVYMIPGNHDWENGGRGGFDAIIRQQLYVDFLGKPNVKYYPEDGCPGPVEVIIDSNVAVIMFDSQWWLHPYDKPEIESDCSSKTKEELVIQIGDLLARNSKRLVLIACHHPFESNGMHGGFYTLKQHIFPLTDMKKNLYIPLPVLGSIYPIARSVFGTPQDIKHPTYTNMIQEISAVVKTSSTNVVFVSGHDHNLQYIKKNGYNYIVSGGGCKQNRTSKSSSSLYNSTSVGFSVMEVSKNKNVTINFYTVTDTSVVKEYSAGMLNFSKIADTTQVAVIEQPVSKYQDTVTIAARKEFAPVSGLKKFFMGQNYRPEWSTPVNMRVFNLSQEKGGMLIRSMGGGKQTKSLQLVDKNGKEWVLRSVVKNSARAIPDVYQSSMAQELVTELSSASHPYSPLIIPELAKAVHIAVPHPELFFIPDDPALGIYRPLFANTVCMLEEKEPSFDGSNTKTTAKTFSKMLEENDHRPDQPAVLRARLLDIVLGDFDRHFDQWKWGTTDTGKGKLYYPIPRDRDQALFHSDGFILKAVSGRAMPFLKGFRYYIPKVNWLGYTARDFDRIFLTDLDATEWNDIIARFQQQLTDSVIRKAVSKLPVETHSFNNDRIIRKLQHRRDLLTKEAPVYYRFISKKVNVVGSNLKEYFKVSQHEKGLQVRVYARSKGTDTSFIMYDRVFDPSVTHEIRLFGLHDNDVFEIDENTASRIKIRIIGGKGYDTFDIKGKTEALLYDQIDGGNFIKNSSRAKNRFSIDAPVNEKSIVGFNYNTTKLPQVIFGYNSDDGFLMGGGVSRRTFGFRNIPYATDQKLSFLYAPGNKAIQFRYRGEFNHITRNNDLLINFQYATPALKNFFGLGNSTVPLPSKSSDYYQTRYRTMEAELLVRKRFLEKMHVMAGPWFFNYQNKYSDNRNTILGQPREVGLDSARIFSKKSYLGAKALIRIDNRNNEVFPTRGLLWNSQFTAAAGMGHGSNNLSSVLSDMTLYASLSDPAKVVAVLKFGGGRIFSKNFEFFQAMDFGSNTNLMGFRKNRFAGRSMLYTGIEMKIKLLEINSYILPGALGITTFYNAGRVWHPNDQPGSWHGAYGFGFYYNPLNLFSITASAGFSDKERIYNITLGTRINLTY
ncbi:MAG: BamA/TamA family outer membrane protein [Chitinophagaceae bacterium]